MIFLRNKNTDPALNHAIEEYFLRETDKEVFSLWQNITCLLLGKNQDLASEINLNFIREYNIPVVRRLSGGGTVFCDLNNLQYTMITKREEDEQSSFKKFAKPVVEFLKSLNLPAEFTGRNDILIDDKKISGNAQYRVGERMIHHGTLLYDADSELLIGSINTRPIKFSNKKVKSVVSRVGKIADYLSDWNVSKFIDELEKYVVDYYEIENVIEVDDEILRKAEKYAKRFRDKNWNYGKDHSGVKVYSEKYDFGLVDYRLKEEDGEIREIALTGDYFEVNDVNVLTEQLIGAKLDEKALEKLLKDIDVAEYIQGMKNDILIEGLMKVGKI